MGGRLTSPQTPETDQRSSVVGPHVANHCSPSTAKTIARRAEEMNVGCARESRVCACGRGIVAMPSWRARWLHTGHIRTVVGHPQAG